MPRQLAQQSEVKPSPSKRERKGNYSIDGYDKKATPIGLKTEKAPKQLRPPKQVTVQDYQFYPWEFEALQDHEANAFKVPLQDPQNEDEAPEMLEAERAAKQTTIDNAEPLTEEEIADEVLTEEIQHKTAEEVKAYVKVFWKRWRVGRIYLLCQLNYDGLKSPDMYDRIKKDITESPDFRFDWFFKSRMP
ncbi:HAND-domain-containing protein [Hysterangium stoloniferum]|nr:HAND-domain-containing protein [Hysterangium stoloniferum]